jgi:ATP-dependent DNA helicase RecQ
MHEQVIFPELKPFQKVALASLKKNAHTILIAPTGSGKSLVFQKYLHDFRAKNRALIVSPLNALARQIADGLSALHLNVNLGVGKNGEGPPSGSGIWIVSPEKVFGSAYARLRDWNPNLLIVDEAHCVWEWGEHFRPEFARVPSLVKALSIPKSFWCSATLPLLALQKIKDDLPSRPHLLGEFALPKMLEIERHSIVPHRKLDLLRSILDKNSQQSGMIFVSTRAAAERLKIYLNAWGFASIFYHAGMSAEERIILEKMLSLNGGKTPIWVVATSAFGMGMNYPFLKVCILFDPSLTLLSLAQALGRIGRGADSARSHIFWHENDFRALKTMVGSAAMNHARIDAVKGWCMTNECPRVHLEKYFNTPEKSGTFEE